MSIVSRYLSPALVEHLNQLSLSARSVVEGAAVGLHRSPVKGTSVEFRQHRFYVAGDEPRRLDWRVLARTDRPYVKEYDEETNLRAMIIIDRSGSMHYGWSAGTPEAGVDLSGSKFDYAAQLAAALAYLMLAQTESVGAALAGNTLEFYLAPHAGSRQLPRILDILDRASPTGESDLPRCLHEAAERLERRALVLVLSDCFTDSTALRKGLAHLRHERHEVIVLQVTHRDEEEFPFRSWTQFRGLESEHPHLCEPAIARQTYLERFTAHRRALQQAAQTLGAEFYSFVTDRAILETLRIFLTRRTGR